MSSTLKSLRALSDPTRLRIVALLERDELSVNELQEITRLGQSRISTHLGLLADCALVQSRRDGKRTFYKFESAGRRCRHRANSSNSPFAARRNCPNTAATRSISSASSPAARSRRRFFSTRSPGGSTASMARAAHGRRSGICCCGFCRRSSSPIWARAKGLLSELLARRCKKVIAVDNSEKIVAFGAAKAKKNGLKNLEFRQGDLQNPPIEPNSVDLVILSQALHHAENPAAAIAGAHKILRRGGQIMILDLLKHNFDKARELYGDRWPGFAESDLHRWLEEAGFKKIEISIVAAEEQPPHFQTILAGAEK